MFLFEDMNETRDKNCRLNKPSRDLYRYIRRHNIIHYLYKAGNLLNVVLYIWPYIDPEYYVYHAISGADKMCNLIVGPWIIGSTYAAQINASLSIRNH